jgi:hypothetical protein
MIYTSAEPTDATYVISTGLAVASFGKGDEPKKPTRQSTYSILNRDQRRVYLTWLSGDRNVSDIHIEYVFLFFYGLEWRYFEVETDEGVEEERKQLMDEVRRLSLAYKYNDSFCECAEKLLIFDKICDSSGFSVTDEEFEKYCHSSSENLNYIPQDEDDNILQRIDRLFVNEGEAPFALEILLGKIVDSHRPIPAMLALKWLKNSRRYRIQFEAIVRRYEEKFDELFMKKYSVRYGEGIVVDRKPGTELYAHYRLESSHSKCFLKKIVGTVNIRHYNYCLVFLQEMVNEVTSILEISYATTWHPKGTVVEIQGIRIAYGMIYTKAGTSNLRCVISTILPITYTAGNIGPKKLDYWPSYSKGTNREQRGAYLMWLASDRSESTIDIGYVFLFFYGLEQRYFEIVGNDGSEVEIGQIKDEIERLIKIYDHNDSFRMYSGRFLNYIETNIALKEEIDVSKFEKYSYFSSEIYETPVDLGLALGNLICQRKPLPATMVLAWLKNPGDYATLFKTSARHCETEFNELFRYRYREKYGDGIIVKVKANTELKLNYVSASSNINVSETEITGVVDIKYYYSYLNELQQIVNEVTSAIEPYSRAVTRKSTSPEGTWLYLPEPLRKQKFAPLLEKLNRGRGRYFLSEIMKMLAVGTHSKNMLQLAVELLDHNNIAYINDIKMQKRRQSENIIPIRKNSAASHCSVVATHQLDQKKIRELEEETELIQDILTQEIFKEESAVTPTDGSMAELKLSRGATILLDHLMGQEEWTLKELEIFARDRQIMLDGALEEINGKFSETFVEIFDNMVYVNPELIKEMNN